MMRLLKILVLGLMLACGTAYASESPSSAPVTNSKARHMNTDLNTDASPAVGDLIFDGGIAFLIIVMGAFFAIGFLDSKEKDSQ
jgi:hypothetical protein